MNTISESISKQNSLIDRENISISKIEKDITHLKNTISNIVSINIDIINESTVVTDTEAYKVISALQIQSTRDYAPAWGINSNLEFIKKGNTPRKGAWQIIILDDADMAGVLGYHDMTYQGLPIGKVFAKTNLMYGLQWSTTASHELLEMLGDPGINLTVLREDVGQLWAYENCDTCEADEFGYEINGILVSDFVFPEWFEYFWPKNSTRFDYSNKISSPFELLPGGYIGYFDLKSGNGWQQLYASSTTPVSKYNSRPKVGSRRERRRLLRSEWVKSDSPKVV